MANSGTPGVGKTLTAEAVSEHLQRPLYSVRTSAFHLSAIGSDSADLCRRLKPRLGNNGSSAFARLPDR